MAGEAALTLALLERIRVDCFEAHSCALALVEDLTDEQVRWQSGPHSPSIGFHLWHLARWAEHDIEQIDGTPQTWRTQALAAAWGFPSDDLGEEETGTEMSDAASALLVIPDKLALLDYARFALGGIDALVARVTGDAERGGTAPELVADLFVYFTHDNRHLGMIEALRGVMGVGGTATR